MTYKYSCDQSNHSYDLHYDFQNWYDWLIVPLLLMAQRSETVRQTRSCYTYLVQRCNPTAAHKPTAAEGNTISVRRHIRGVSELTIRHRG